MEDKDVIQPTFILQKQGDNAHPVLMYNPLTQCVLFNCGSGNLGFLDIISKKIIKKLLIPQLSEYGVRVALSPDGFLLATNSYYHFQDQFNIIPTQVRIFDISNSSTDFPGRSFFVKPDFEMDFLTNVKFFPDGSKIIATNCTQRDNGPWCKIFKLAEGFWLLEESTQRIKYVPQRNSKTLMHDEIDIRKQGFSFDEEGIQARARKLASENDEEFMHRYNEATYFSKMNGFHSVALSPDNTQLLAGNHDGEIYIIEVSSLKVLQCIRAYWYYMVVRGCSYNPSFGHEQFATCDENGIFDIWNVTTSANGNEEASSVHRLTFESATSCCSYSPDGKLIAVASRAFKMYIVDSEFGCIMYSLVYAGEETGYDSAFRYSSLFVGHSCQVVAVQRDCSICFWKLPVIYTLETSCLLLLRSLVSYKTIGELHLPSRMKLRLKYLYV